MDEKSPDKFSPTVAVALLFCQIAAMLRRA
jgi:hypothetical protein